MTLAKLTGSWKPGAEGERSLSYADHRLEPWPRPRAWRVSPAIRKSGKADRDPAPHRGGQWKGGRGQVHRQRQSRARAPARRGPDWAARRRSLRAEHPRNAGSSHGSAAGSDPGPKDGPPGAARPEGHLDGHAEGGRRPGDPAWTDGGQVPELLHRLRTVGTVRRPDPRPSPRNGGHPVDAASK